MPIVQGTAVRLMRNPRSTAMCQHPIAGMGILLFVCLFLLAPFIAPATAHADDDAPLRIGVLSYYELDLTNQQWQPLAYYLTEQLPGQRFELRTLFLDDLTKAVERDEFDFVLTNPQHYVRLRAQHRNFVPIATLATNHNGHPLASLGGVIVRHQNRKDITSLADLRGKRIAAANRNSTGGFLLQQWALMNAGIDIQEKAAEIVFVGQPLNRIIELVLQGKVDVGFVRTGVIEDMIAKGKLKPNALQVINPRHEADFPLLLSTSLAPEWPFLANQRVPLPILKALTRALLLLEPDNPAALAGKFHSFSPVADYSQVEMMMLDLHAHPEREDRFDLTDVIEKYPIEAFSALGGLLLLTLAGTALLIRSRQQVGTTLRERSSLLDSIGEGIYGIDNDGRCTFINPKALEMLGYQHDEIIGRDSHALFHHHRLDGNDYPVKECPVYRTLIDGQRRQGEEWFFRRSGEAFPVAFLVTRIRSRQSVRRGVIVTFRDISQERLADEMTRIAAIAFETQEGMIVTNAHNRILRVNQAFSQITGYTTAEAIGQTPVLLKSGRHDAAFYQEMWDVLLRQGLWRGEIWNRRKNGEIYPEWLSISTVRDAQGKISHYVGAFLDITQRKAAEKQIHHLAYYDPLTGLPNRSLLNERLSKALAAGSRYRRHSALLFMDLDDFKTLNDTMGHVVGDQLLIQVARRLQQSVR
ncbi:MAG: PhnD/SsuA/transferrin family substrate-binding protein, partial [Betaproteobacteria bacterium]|nr:PhnD/SsuA/transferrin family substrate-binding protein [Betaproteobacteria bacterium]MCL2885781.1 PhnD/SsuA/transferrin family substrate-binding protein [Betaproteobacteria bacterium]